MVGGRLVDFWWTLGDAKEKTGMEGGGTVMEGGWDGDQKRKIQFILTIGILILLH